MFTIKARRGILTRATSHNDITDISADETSGSFDVSVIYVPRSPSKAHIAFALSQRTFFEGCSLKTPVLAVSAMIPDDSEVFRVIKNGELDRLMKMLTLRQASLTDRDTKGRCLLNVSSATAFSCERPQRDNNDSMLFSPISLTYANFSSTRVLM